MDSSFYWPIADAAPCGRPSGCRHVYVCRDFRAGGVAASQSLQSMQTGAVGMASAPDWWAHGGGAVKNQASRTIARAAAACPGWAISGERSQCSQSPWRFRQLRNRRALNPWHARHPPSNPRPLAKLADMLMLRNITETGACRKARRSPRNDRLWPFHDVCFRLAKPEADLRRVGL